MKITKFVHSCLLVEFPAPINKTVLFDPGAMSEAALNVDKLEFLDDLIITHAHGDHYHLPNIQRLLAKFPDVRITATPEIVEKLQAEGITASSTPREGIVLFDSPHESVAPLFPQPQEIGVHYQQLLTHPGDSHSFSETMPVLALPVQAPWGSTIDAVNLAIKLKPKYVVPIHDWHWSDDARAAMYDIIEGALAKQDIIFLKPQTGQAIVIDL